VAHGQTDSTGSHAANWIRLYGWQVTDDLPCSSHPMPVIYIFCTPLQSTWLADHVLETPT